jgi:hypothetical protein
MRFQFFPWLQRIAAGEHEWPSLVWFAFSLGGPRLAVWLWLCFFLRYQRSLV